MDLAFTWTSGNTTDGFADDLSLTIGANLPAPKLTAPASKVPGFDHVFVVYLENQDFGDNHRQQRQGPLHQQPAGLRHTSLTQSYATTHPSDPNYVALAGGGPLRPVRQQQHPASTPRTSATTPSTPAGKTWKAYTESANGNCDTSSHGDYWADQLPFNSFANMRDDTSPDSYCAQLRAAADPDVLPT
ncbi:hypothetical protein [Kitasatospora paracochleata]|uniref:Phosphoesterase family protein n=1 Tax=Kitasatospora paracochleata TaxID=58354 RepID=A0ABT1JB31_9ACTN|nr:hypothetical protein [Kitasatospora paracochleata]MCP2314662.1 hypothetical protein [Kitasatospora paracochleata]